MARGRIDTAAHRRDREIRACHLLLQRRARGGISRRKPHPRALAQGRDLRSEARDVGARGDRQAGRRRSRRGSFDVIVVNYANTDMVGHTGDLAAAIKAVETVDACLGRLAAAVDNAGGALLITADHGNAEMMRDPKHRPAAHRAHHQSGAAAAGQPAAPASPACATASSPTSRRRFWRCWDSSSPRP